MAIVVRLLVSLGYERKQRLKIDVAGAFCRFRKLSGEELMPLRYPAASAIVVTVIVWLWSSQTPDTRCGEISP